MEEAYAQLYQEFVHLRSLCLRQASLLEQLTAALKQQQGRANGADGADGADEDIAIPSPQLDSEVLVYLNRTPPPLFSAAAACGVQGPSEPMGNSWDLLTQDMTKLSVEVQRKEPELSVPLSLSSVMTLSPGASHHNGDFTNTNVTNVTNQIPVTSCLAPPLGNSMSTGQSETLWSDVALLSQVCEFCQAVFPSNTTTRGQYLQHLYTHIT